MPYHLRSRNLTCVHKMDANYRLCEKWTATSDRLSKLAQKYEEGTRSVLDLSVISLTLVLAMRETLLLRKLSLFSKMS